MRRLVGAVVGGAIGYGLFWWQQQTGVWIVAATGICLALGAGLMGTCRSFRAGVVFCLAAVAFTLIIAWHNDPLSRDRSLFDYAAEVPRRPANVLWTYLAVAAAGFWFGMGRNRRGSAPR